MKKCIGLMVAAVVVVLLSRCSHEEQSVAPDRTQVINDDLNTFARILSVAIEDPGLRQLIRRETNKKFDFDYDILYRFIADKTIVTQSYGEIMVKDLLLKTWNAIDQEEHSAQDLLKIATSVENLNLYVPNEFDLATANIHIGVLAVDFDEKDSYARSFYRGHEGKLTKETWKANPVIVVGNSERVDDQRRVRVNFQGIVLPHKDRLLSADEAYLESSKPGGMSRFASASPFVKVYSNAEYEEFLKRESVQFEHSHDHLDNSSIDSEAITIGDESFVKGNSKAKVECIFTSGLPGGRVRLVGPNRVLVEITSVPGGTSYTEIWMSTNSGAYNLVTSLTAPNNEHYIDGIGNGTLVKVILRSVNYQNCTSNYSGVLGNAYDYQAGIYGVGHHVSWRSIYMTEKVTGVDMNEDCYEKNEWLAGDLELYFKILPFDNATNQAVTINNVLLVADNEDGVNSYSLNLWKWDRNRYRDCYVLAVWEDDGGNNQGDRKTFTHNYIRPGGTGAASISFTIDDKDDYFYYADIQYNHLNGRWYGLSPEKGGTCSIRIGASY